MPFFKPLNSKDYILTRLLSFDWFTEVWKVKIVIADACDRKKHLFVCLIKGSVVGLYIASRFETLFAVFTLGPALPPLSEDVSGSAG